MDATTIADVARIAGVSASTVSHVVNATRPVAAETRRLVLEAIEAIEATGYVPNRQARSLVRSRSQLLGLAISVMTNPYFGDLVRDRGRGERRGLHPAAGGHPRGPGR